MKKTIPHQNTEDKLVGLTPQQRKALELYCGWLADILNEAGLDQRIVLKPSVSIDWTKQDVKDKIIRPIYEAYTKKHSTKDMNTEELTKTYDFVHRHLTEKFGAVAEFPPFPSVEEVIMQEQILKRKSNGNRVNKGTHREDKRPGSYNRTKPAGKANP